MQVLRHLVHVSAVVCPNRPFTYVVVNALYARLVLVVIRCVAQTDGTSASHAVRGESRFGHLAAVDQNVSARDSQGSIGTSEMSHGTDYLIKTKQALSAKVRQTKQTHSANSATAASSTPVRLSLFNLEI